MKNTRAKMMMSGIALLVAILMVAGASLAWFTLSTKPEANGISLKLSTGRTLLVSGDGVNYEYSINLSDRFLNLAPLHPVSTTDGVHWFIPTYGANGSPDDYDEFILDLVGAADGYQYDNISTAGYTGLELLEREDMGYYVWTDFYIKTEEKDGCEVRLSIPKTINEKELDGFYGSYVLPQYALNSKGEAVPISQNAECSVRIGFLITAPGTPEDGRFVIYEPNADKRSENSGDSKKPTDSDAYVLGYEIDADEYIDGNYIPTTPVGVETVETGDKEDYYSPYLGSGAPTDGTTLYVEREYVPAGAFVAGGTDAYYQHGYEPYNMEHYTAAGAPTLYRKDGGDWVACGADEVQAILADPSFVNDPDDPMFFYHVAGYTPYRGDGWGTPDLFMKNYIFPKYALEGTNLHYFIRSFTPYTGDYTEEEPPLLYIQTDPDSPYTLAEYTPGGSFFEETLTPYTGKLGVEVTPSEGETFVAIGYEEAEFENDPSIKYYTRAKRDVTLEVRSLAPVDDDRMIVQKAGAYDEEKVKEELGKKSDDYTPVIDSTMVDSFGQFIRQYGEVTDISEDITDDNSVYYSDTVIVHLTYNVPVQIRLFIWIEGQDADCWNDITSGLFNINLEFAGTTR